MAPVRMHVRRPQHARENRRAPAAAPRHIHPVALRQSRATGTDVQVSLLRSHPFSDARPCDPTGPHICHVCDPPYEEGHDPDVQICRLHERPRQRPHRRATHHLQVCVKDRHRILLRRSQLHSLQLLGRGIEHQDRVFGPGRPAVIRPTAPPRRRHQIEAVSPIDNCDRSHPCAPQRRQHRPNARIPRRDRPHPLGLHHLFGRPHQLESRRS